MRDCQTLKIAGSSHRDRELKDPTRSDNITEHDVTDESSLCISVCVKKELTLLTFFFLTFVCFTPQHVLTYYISLSALLTWQFKTFNDTSPCHPSIKLQDNNRLIENEWLSR